MFPQRERIQAMVLILQYINTSNLGFWRAVNNRLQEQLSSPDSASRQNCGSSRSDFIYISHVFAAGTCTGGTPEADETLLTIEEYRSKAKGLPSVFQEERFNHIIDQTRLYNSGAKTKEVSLSSDESSSSSMSIANEAVEIQLLCFVVPHGSARWHVLCAATVPKGKNDTPDLTLGMMQLE